MFEAYSAHEFMFYKTRSGKIYVSNIDEMIEIHGLQMVEDAINACELYNSINGVQENV